jgi:hypothetical protein
MLRSTHRNGPSPATAVCVNSPTAYDTSSPASRQTTDQRCCHPADRSSPIRPSDTERVKQRVPPALMRPQNRTSRHDSLAAAFVYALTEVPHPTRQAPRTYAAGPIFEPGVNWSEKHVKVSTKNDLPVSSRVIRPTSDPRPVHHRGVIYLEKSQQDLQAKPRTPSRSSRKRSLQYGASRLPCVGRSMALLFPGLAVRLAGKRGPVRVLPATLP